MTEKRRRKFSKPGFAKKSLGQNFLVDKNYIQKIIAALDPRRDETVIEIGAGRGAITKEIVEYAEKVIAIEIDRELIPLLREEFGARENFILIEKDALEIDFSALTAFQSPAPKTKLVANLPYYISTAILQHLIGYRRSFSEMILMLQKEVVERIISPPGNKERGFLTVLIERYFDTEKLFDVPGNAFRPSPKVTSSIVRLKPIEFSGVSGDEELFRRVVSAAFSQKRKTISNNLKTAGDDISQRLETNGGLEEVFRKANIEPSKRAEALTIAEWESLLEIVGHG